MDFDVGGRTAYAVLNCHFTSIHCSLGISLIFANRFRVVVVHIILDIVPQINIRWCSSSVTAAPTHITLCTDQALLKLLSTRLGNHLMCVGWPSLSYCKPLSVLIYSSASSQWCPKLPEQCHIALSKHCLRSKKIFILTPIWADIAIFRDGCWV